jgi:hypothetical protein
LAFFFSARERERKKKKKNLANFSDFFGGEILAFVPK